jgi:hypothetical protein
LDRRPCSRVLPVAARHKGALFLRSTALTNLDLHLEQLFSPCVGGGSDREHGYHFAHHRR